jgi:putative sterol carrier protein
MVKFGTMEWANELHKLWEADKDLLKILKGLNTERRTIVTDKPDMPAIYEKIVDGHVVEIRPAKPGEWTEFSYAATWENWQNLMQGKLEPNKMMLTGKIKIEGQLSKMMAYTRGWTRIMDLQKKLTYEW